MPFLATLAAATLFSFLSGGYVLGRSTPIAVVLLVLAAVWVWFLRRRSLPSLLLLSGIGLFGLFVLWTGLSVLWSVGPDLTWVAFNLSAFYLAVVAILGVTSVRGLQLRTAGYGYLVLATAVGIYAFLGKALPDRVTHAHTYARLDSPVGYWNVLALMMVMGLCVALALAGDRTARPAWRALAAAAGVPLAFTFFFTFSRGGWIVFVLALVLYFVFTTTRLASLLSLVAIVSPVALALWRLRSLDTLFTETTDDALRALQGHALLEWSLAALLVTVGAQLVIALLHQSVRWPRWSRVAAGAVATAIIAVAAVGGTGTFVRDHGGVPWVKDRIHALATDTDAEDGGSGNAVGRLGSLNTGRPQLWREAVDQWRYDGVAGVGAGTFPFTHYRFRGTYGGVVKHAHSQWFNVLSELGAVGLVLFVAAMVLLVAAAIGNPFSHRRDPLHPLLVAMQAGVIAFFVHISWDWDWDMAAIGTVVFLFIAACASYRRTREVDERRAAEDAAGRREEPPETGELLPQAYEADGPPRHGRGPSGPRPLGWAPRVVATAALLLLALSWLPPYLAHRAENDALAAAGDGDIAVGLEHARRAARLDPLSVEPLMTEASLLQQLGRARQAQKVLRSAADLQPDNYEVWYELGLLQLRSLGKTKAAKASFKRALGLNPADAASRLELTLIGG